MKALYTDGRSGFFREQEPITKTTQEFAGGWCLIKAKGAVSYFDEIKDTSIKNGKALEVEMPVYIEAWKTPETSPLKEGDELIPLLDKISCWTTDCAVSVSEGEVDRTSQCDIIRGEKDIVGDGNFSDTGTINGYYESESQMQRDLENGFIPQIIDDNGKKTYVPRSKNRVFWHWFKTREETEAGEVETTLIRKMKIGSINTGQPSSGSVQFAFNYTTLASYNYRKTVEETA